MPLILHQFGVPGAPLQPGYAEARELARHCVDQYTLNTMFGPGGGIAGASCWAAVAVVPTPAFPALYPAGGAFAGAPGAGGAALGFGAVFGNSQMVSLRRYVVVPGYQGAHHAERAALRAAGIAGCALYPLGGAANTAVLFVQLSPCGPCTNWLNGIPGRGAANPYAGLVAGALTLHVWYRWPHPAGVPAMTAWNLTTRLAKLADINANW